MWKLALVSRVKNKIIYSWLCLYCDSRFHQNSWENRCDDLRISGQFGLKPDLIQLFDFERLILSPVILIDYLSHPHDNVSITLDVLDWLFYYLFENWMDFIKRPGCYFGILSILLLRGSHCSTVSRFKRRLRELRSKFYELVHRNLGWDILKVKICSSLLLENLWNCI